MKTHPYLIIKKGDEAQALFIGQMISFAAADDESGTDVLMADGNVVALDIDFDSFCRMINAETEVEPDREDKET
jgi:hypothetical protein